MKIYYFITLFCFILGCGNHKDGENHKDEESKVVYMGYNISIDEIRDILGKKDESDPFYSPERAEPRELIERAGVPLKGARIYIVYSTDMIYIEAAYKTQKAIQVLIGREGTE